MNIGKSLKNSRMTVSESIQEKKTSAAYQRIMDILYDYWLSVPDEEYVQINMYFRKADGQEQEKKIVWASPECQKKDTSSPFKMVQACDLLKDFEAEQ